MTTDEARSKWCPMVQIAITPTGDVVTNRLEQFNNIDCKADECACWVWDGPKSEMGLKKDWQGHCGLAR